MMCLMSSFAIATEAEIEKYVNELLNSTFKVLNDTSVGLDQKKSKLRDILKENLGVADISVRVIGRLKNNYSPEELKAFQDTYEQYLINSYANAVENYKGQKVSIKSINQPAPNNYQVQTEIIDNNNQTFNVNYLVKAENGHFKILDVITEGVSLVATHKSEFANILGNNNMAFLIKQLQSKIK